MKKTLLSTVCILAIFSLYSFAQTKTATRKTTTTHKATSTTKHKTVTKITKTINKKPSVAELAEGKALLAKSDCLTCHKVDMKVVGPAYKDVAKKYPSTEANYQLLTKKVIAGGSGNWGPVAMAPHANLPEGEVKKMVVYILSLNN
jgi:cytochrome c